MGMVNYKKKVNIHPTTKWIMKPNTSTPKESIKRDYRLSSYKRNAGRCNQRYRRIRKLRNHSHCR